MNSERTTAIAPREEARSAGSAPVVLAVGDRSAWAPANRNTPHGTSLAFAQFEDVTSELMSRLAPEVVVSSPLARRFDCIELAQRLHALGFTGCYRVLADNLPRPGMVLNEMRSFAPGLEIEVESGRHQGAA